MTRRRSNLRVIWEGPSALAFDITDDEGNVVQHVPAGVPIVALAVLRGSNEKTGDMVQVYILRQDMPPTEAVRQGLDGAICGNCIHRSKAGGGLGSCYVVHLFVNQVWARWKAGQAEPLTRADMRGKLVRFGAYGDPAALPLDVLQALRAGTPRGGWTGYTHQWKTCDPAYAELLMASTETDAQTAAAEALGYRAFQVYAAGAPKPANVVRCPWSEDRPGGPRPIQCAACLKCSGTGGGRKGHVGIVAHGSRAGAFNRAALPLTVVGAA